MLYLQMFYDILWLFVLFYLMNAILYGGRETY